MLRLRKRKYDDPLLHPDHARPKTRREFLAQGFIMGTSTVLGSAMVTLPGNVHAALSPDLVPLISDCGIATQGAGKIPFIAFDLAGGSNQAGDGKVVVAGDRTPNELHFEAWLALVVENAPATVVHGQRRRASIVFANALVRQRLGFELEPARGTKSSRVVALADDVARSMSAVSARISVIPGRNAIGIELPNMRRETFGLKELIHQVLQPARAPDGDPRNRQ